MCSDDESPMPSHRKCKNITKVFPYNLENFCFDDLLQLHKEIYRKTKQMEVTSI